MAALTNQEIMRLYGAMYETGDLSIADAIIADDFIDHSQPERAAPWPCGSARDAAEDAHGLYWRFPGRGLKMKSRRVPDAPLSECARKASDPLLPKYRPVPLKVFLLLNK